MIKMNEPWYFYLICSLIGILQGFCLWIFFPNIIVRWMTLEKYLKYQKYAGALLITLMNILVFIIK